MKEIIHRSRSCSKFWWCKCLISCCQRQNIEEEDTEMVERRRFAHATQTDPEKVSDESRHRIFHRSSVADRSRRFDQFAKVQRGVSLPPNMYRHSV